MRLYVLAMSKFFRNHYHALQLLTDEEFATLAFAAMAHQAEKHDEHYCSLDYL